MAQSEVHGFLGPNGSGKSATIRVLLGLLRANSGTVTLFGGDPWRDGAELHKRLAYVPGDVNLWPNLSGGEVIYLLGKLRCGLNERRRAELVEHFELDPTKKGRTYSKGNRQKVALAAALASDVDLLILDEPTTGLDPIMEAVFQAYIDDFKDDGHSVLLSSHILAEVESLCDRVSITRAGKTVESGTLSELRHLTRTSISAETARPATGLGGLAGIHDLVVEGNRARFDIDTVKLGDALACHGEFGIESLTSQPPTLEELFLRRDRASVFWWILGGVVLYWSQAVSVDTLYATQAEFDKAAASMQNNAALIAMTGPVRSVAMRRCPQQLSSSRWPR